MIWYKLKFGNPWGEQFWFVRLGPFLPEKGFHLLAATSPNKHKAHRFATLATAVHYWGNKLNRLDGWTVVDNSGQTYDLNILWQLAKTGEIALPGTETADKTKHG